MKLFVMLFIHDVVIAQSYPNVIAIGLYDDVRVPGAARLVDSFTLDAPFQAWGRTPYLRLLDSAKSNAKQMGGNMIEVVTYDNMYSGSKWRSAIKVRVYQAGDRAMKDYKSALASRKQTREELTGNKSVVHVKCHVPRANGTTFYFNDSLAGRSYGKPANTLWKRHAITPQLNFEFGKPGKLCATADMNKSKSHFDVQKGNEYYLVYVCTAGGSCREFELKSVDKDTFENDY